MDRCHFLRHLALALIIQSIRAEDVARCGNDAECASVEMLQPHGSMALLQKHHKQHSDRPASEEADGSVQHKRKETVVNVELDAAPQVKEPISQLDVGVPQQRKPREGARAIHEAQNVVGKLVKKADVDRFQEPDIDLEQDEVATGEFDQEDMAATDTDTIDQETPDADEVDGAKIDIVKQVAEVEKELKKLQQQVERSAKIEPSAAHQKNRPKAADDEQSVTGTDSTDALQDNAVDKGIAQSKDASKMLHEDSKYGDTSEAGATVTKKERRPSEADFEETVGAQTFIREDKTKGARQRQKAKATTKVAAHQKESAWANIDVDTLERRLPKKEPASRISNAAKEPKAPSDKYDTQSSIENVKIEDDRSRQQLQAKAMKLEEARGVQQRLNEFVVKLEAETAKQEERARHARAVREAQNAKLAKANTNTAKVQSDRVQQHDKPQSASGRTKKMDAPRHKAFVGMDEADQEDADSDQQNDLVGKRIMSAASGKRKIQSDERFDGDPQEKDQEDFIVDDNSEEDDEDKVAKKGRSHSGRGKEAAHEKSTKRRNVEKPVKRSKSSLADTNHPAYGGAADDAYGRIVEEYGFL